jgi:hypothetical protein
MNDTFAARVELYGEWDRKLHSHTRFFGAAALVNSALAELWPRCALARFAYGPGLSFLASLGEYLQTFNVAMLHRIESGQWCAGDWDTALVKLEQAAVETRLARLEQSDSRMHANVTRQLDRFLYCLARRIGGSVYGPSTVVLSGGLREIQFASARALRFASLSDRVTVGTTLIRIMRDTADVGSRLAPPACTVVSGRNLRDVTTGAEPRFRRRWQPSEDYNLCFEVRDLRRRPLPQILADSGKHAQGQFSF